MSAIDIAMPGAGLEPKLANPSGEYRWEIINML
jgi:hypothetical protein